MSTPKRSYGWCYVIHHADDRSDDVQRLKTLTCRYHIIGYQQDMLGHPIVVGFIYFKNRRSWKGVRNLLYSSYVEKQSCLSSVCVDFCKRSGSYYESGKQPQDRTTKAMLKSALESVVSTPNGSMIKLPRDRSLPQCRCLNCEYKEKLQALKDKQSKSV